MVEVAKGVSLRDYVSVRRQKDFDVTVRRQTKRISSPQPLDADQLHASNPDDW